MTEIDPFLHDDAAYVLGALDDAGRRAFEEHLETCPECRARVAEVRPTAALLAGISLSALEDAGPVPDTLLPGLLARAGRERSRRRLVTAALGAVAAACVAALIVVLWPTGSPASGPAPQAFAAVRTSPVTATARLVPKAWGTEIDLRCHYSDGTTGYVPYKLVVIDKQNHEYDAGTWGLVPGQETTFTGGTAVKRDDIDSIQIAPTDGTAILQLKP
jgi:hypothetical protein